MRFPSSWNGNVSRIVDEVVMCFVGFSELTGEIEVLNCGHRGVFV